MSVNGRPTATREHILQSALKIFADCGYAGTSIQKIVDKARVSKPALYYYFEDKAALFRGLVDQAHDKRLRLMEKAAENGGSVAEKLEEILSAVFDFAVKNRELMRLAFATAFAAKGETPVQSSCCEKGRKNFEFIRDLIQSGQESGELSGKHTADEMTMGIYGQLNTYVMLRVFTPEIPLDRERAKAIVRLFLDGAGEKKLQNSNSKFRRRSKFQAPNGNYKPSFPLPSPAEGEKKTSSLDVLSEQS
jgi:AcrR family transcriptional regulator